MGQEPYVVIPLNSQNQVRTKVVELPVRRRGLPSDVWEAGMDKAN